MIRRDRDDQVRHLIAIRVGESTWMSVIDQSGAVVITYGVNDATDALPMTIYTIPSVKNHETHMLSRAEWNRLLVHAGIDDERLCMICQRAVTAPYPSVPVGVNQETA
jgi:hypothetical protein